MLLQLNPPIPVETPQGAGQAVVLIDYGPDYDLLWVVFLNATGECWTFKNPLIRAVENLTLDHHTAMKHRPPAMPRQTLPDEPRLAVPANGIHGGGNGSSNGNGGNGR